MYQTNTATRTMEVPRDGKSSILWLEVGDSNVHRSYAVGEGSRLVVGKAATCDVVVRDSTVSERHCEVGRKRGVLWVRDLGSKNGIYAGGARVTEARLQPGACFAVGRVAMSVRAGGGERATAAPLPGVVGTSAPMMRVAAHARRLARLAVPILIRGATGTGKEVVARAIHTLSARSTGPFVPLNAGAIPASLAAAELFGHDRGAFTGAGQPRKGAFLAADQGTIFLDEIGEASAELQVLLLRVLEQREVQPLGSDRTMRVDARIISATWAPLEQAIRTQAFRRDLFHRLAVGTIQLPSLAERKSDIGLLAAHVLHSRRNEVGERQLTPAALGRLTAHDWPGNVRELANVVLRAAVLSDQPWIHAEDVDVALSSGRRIVGRLSPEAAQALVEECGGRVATAARRCGVARSTFRGWLRGANRSERP